MQNSVVHIVSYAVSYAVGGRKKTCVCRKKKNKNNKQSLK